MLENKIISNPLLTEKTTIQEGNGKYTFRVLKKTNKNEVKKAIERIFGVKVTDVNIVNTKEKIKRRGKTYGKVSGFKKAVVTLVKGQTIKLREEKKEGKKASAAKKEKTEKKTGEKKQSNT